MRQACVSHVIRSLTQRSDRLTDGYLTEKTFVYGFSQSYSTRFHYTTIKPFDSANTRLKSSNRNVSLPPVLVIREGKVYTLRAHILVRSRAFPLDY